MRESSCSGTQPAMRPDTLERKVLGGQGRLRNITWAPPIGPLEDHISVGSRVRDGWTPDLRQPTRGGLWAQSSGMHSSLGDAAASYAQGGPGNLWGSCTVLGMLRTRASTLHRNYCFLKNKQHHYHTKEQYLLNNEIYSQCLYFQLFHNDIHVFNSSIDSESK